MNIIRIIKIKSLNTPLSDVERLYLNKFAILREYEKDGCIFLVLEDAPKVIHYRYRLADNYLFYDYNRVWMDLKYNMNIENVNDFIYDTVNKFGLKVKYSSFEDLQIYR